MLYGGVWKHVLFNPPDYMWDVAEASKHALHFIKTRHPRAMTENFTMKCLSRLDLWYTQSDHMPAVFTKTISDSSGHEHPISVPLSMGITYNFQLTSTKNASVTVHFVTVTKTLEIGELFVYIYTFYELDDNTANKHLDQCHRFSASKGRSSSTQVLSNLAKSKELEVSPDQICDIAVKDNRYSQAHNKYMSQVLPMDGLANKSPQGLKQSRRQPHQNDEVLKETILTVMSYNIWNFNTFHHQNSGYPQRMHRLLKFLRDVEPDIVAFQEVRLETPLGGHLGPSQIDHLMLQMPQYQFVYQPAQMQRNSLEQGRTEEGVAIFSKFPIIHHDYLLLFRNQSNSADQNQRVCLHVVISVPVFGKVHIFNTHFSLSHEAREVAVKQIMEYMSNYGGDFVILMGDLNATPEEKAIRMLTTDSGLLDIWDLLYPNSQGFTFSCIEENLSKRIDYILMKKTEGVKALKMEVLPDKNRSDAASDHRAVMATFVKHDAA